MKLFLLVLGVTILLEGLMPFFFPNAYRDFLREVSNFDSGILRIFGLLAIIFGIVLMYIAKGLL